MTKGGATLFSSEVIAQHLLEVDDDWCFIGDVREPENVGTGHGFSHIPNWYQHFLVNRDATFEQPYSIIRTINEILSVDCLRVHFMKRVFTFYHFRTTFRYRNGGYRAVDCILYTTLQWDFNYEERLAPPFPLPTQMIGMLAYF